MSEPNPNWIDAPYKVGFLIAIPELPMPGSWSRRRRLKAIRRHRKQYIAAHARPPEFRPGDYEGEYTFYHASDAPDAVIMPVFTRLIMPRRWR